jgi:hypothetical protein
LLPPPSASLVHEELVLVDACHGFDLVCTRSLSSCWDASPGGGGEPVRPAVAFLLVNSLLASTKRKKIYIQFTSRGHLPMAWRQHMRPNEQLAS